MQPTAFTTPPPPPPAPKQSTLLVFCTALKIFEILKLDMVEEQE